jgi:hypothetical protein
MYSKSDRPFPLVLFQVARAVLTGHPPKVADVRDLGPNELRKPLNSPDLR